MKKDTHAIILRRFNVDEDRDEYSIAKTGPSNIDAVGIRTMPEDILIKIDLAHASDMAKHATDIYIVSHDGLARLVTTNAPNYGYDNISWIEVWEDPAKKPFDLIYTACHVIGDRKFITKAVCDCISHINGRDATLDLFYVWAETDVGEYYLYGIREKIWDGGSARLMDLFSYVLSGDIFGAAECVEFKHISGCQQSELIAIIRQQIPLRKLLLSCVTRDYQE